MTRMPRTRWTLGWPRMGRGPTKSRLRVRPVLRGAMGGRPNGTAISNGQECGRSASLVREAALKDVLVRQ